MGSLPACAPYVCHASDTAVPRPIKQHLFQVVEWAGGCDTLGESTILYSNTCWALSCTQRWTPLSMTQSVKQAPDTSCYKTANRLCTPAFHVMWFSCSYRIFLSSWTESSGHTGTASKLFMGSPWLANFFWFAPSSDHILKLLILLFYSFPTHSFF